MSMLRDPRGRAFDRDLGPSGHASSGHHFMSLADLPTPADIKRAEDLRTDMLRQRANREARRLANRCGFLMPTHGRPCDRPMGHGTTHRSVLYDRPQMARVMTPRGLR